jgi:tetratricopeptide (TPR) repeat protein
LIDSVGTRCAGQERCPEYEREWRLGEAAKDEGRLEDARRHYCASGEAARHQGSAELVDRALCNEAAVAIALGEVEPVIPRLREILIRNQSQINCFLAAYTIARAYELRKDSRKGLFYARLARDRAEVSGRREWLASAWNQIANFLLGDSFFDEAAATYRRAVTLLPGEESPRQLVYLANLAYCDLVMGRLRSGLSMLYRCLRTARRRGWRRGEMIAHVDLCYAQLELGRLAHAERHGRRGLALAETSGETDWVKNALYLLGEVAVQAGAAGEGRERFAELQRRFYPDQPYLSEFLATVDVRQLVNLRA